MLLCWPVSVDGRDPGEAAVKHRHIREAVVEVLIYQLARHAFEPYARMA